MEEDYHEPESPEQLYGPVKDVDNPGPDGLLDDEREMKKAYWFDGGTSCRRDINFLLSRLRSARQENATLREKHNEEVDEFNAGFNAYKKGTKYEDEPSETPHDQWRVGWAWAWFDDHYQENANLKGQLLHGAGDLITLARTKQRLEVELKQEREENERLKARVEELEKERKYPDGFDLKRYKKWYGKDNFCPTCHRYPCNCGMPNATPKEVK